jgi:DinB superfamily
MRQRQGELHQELRAESIAMRERLASLLRSLDASRLSEHPEPNGWSVGQVLEHLCVTDEVSVPLAEAVLRSARPDAGAPAREWKSTLIGGFIADSLRNKRPLRAARVFRPGPTPRSGIVEKFLASELNFVNAMDAAGSFDWRALRVRSAALPRWAPKMNLGDGFRIHVIHVARHAKQIERVAGNL